MNKFLHFAFQLFLFLHVLSSCLYKQSVPGTFAVQQFSYSSPQLFAFLSRMDGYERREPFDLDEFYSLVYLSSSTSLFSEWEHF